MFEKFTERSQKKAYRSKFPGHYDRATGESSPVRTHPQSGNHRHGIGLTNFSSLRL